MGQRDNSDGLDNGAAIPRVVVEVHDNTGVQVGNHNEMHLHLPPEVGAPAAVVEAIRPDDARIPELFVGRVDQVEELLGVLAPDGIVTGQGAGTVVLSAVEGMGGIGKTALARRVAATAVDRGWFLGAFVVDLQGYDPEVGMRVRSRDVVASLLREFGVAGNDIPVTVSEQFTVYHQILARWAGMGRRVLLVLDNASTTEQVSALLPRHQCHRVVVTTRDTLALPGAPLRMDLDVLSVVDAVAMLEQVLALLCPGDLRPSREPESVVGLVEVCGRLPLAVEIAAALLAEDPDQTVADLVSELERTSTRLDSLRYGDKAVDAVLGLSWHRLLTSAPEAARVLALLPVNPGPDISTTAAAALTGVAETLVRPWLRALRQAHLLRRDGGRWAMHDLVRLDAQARATSVIDAEDLAAATGRLLDYYLRTTEAADGQVGFAGRDEASAWLDSERPNLVGAVRLAANSGHHRVAVDLSETLSDFLDRRRHFQDRVEVATVAVEAASRLDDPLREGNALGNLGRSKQNVRQFDDAIAAYQQADAIFRALGRFKEVALTLDNLGIVYQQVRRFDEAATAHRQALRIHQRLNDRHGVAHSLYLLGLVLKELKYTEEASAVNHEALRLYRTLGDRGGEAVALGKLGEHLRDVGRHDQALAAHQRILDIYREDKDRHGEGIALMAIGSTLHDMARLDEALVAKQQAVDILDETGDLHIQGMAVFNLGETLRKLDLSEREIAAYRCAAEIFQVIDDLYLEGKSRGMLGTRLAHEGRFPEAAAELRRAGVLFAAAGERIDHAQARFQLGLALRELGRLEDAITEYRSAAEICQQIGARHHEGTMRGTLGRALVEAGDVVGARHEWERAQRAFSAFGSARDVEIVRRLLEGLG